MCDSGALNGILATLIRFRDVFECFRSGGRIKTSRASQRRALKLENEEEFIWGGPWAVLKTAQYLKKPGGLVGGPADRPEYRPRKAETAGGLVGGPLTAP